MAIGPNKYLTHAIILEGIYATPTYVKIHAMHRLMLHVKYSCNMLISLCNMLYLRKRNKNIHKIQYMKICTCNILVYMQY